MLANIERAGIRVDPKALDTMSVAMEKEVRRLEKEIWELAAVEFNVNSPTQLAEILFDKLGLQAPFKRGKGRVRSTAAEVLEELAELVVCVAIVGDAFHRAHQGLEGLGYVLRALRSAAHHFARLASVRRAAEADQPAGAVCGVSRCCNYHTAPSPTLEKAASAISIRKTACQL